MGKLERMMASGSANIAESMGVGVTRGKPAEALTSSAPARWQGVSKSKSAVEIPLDKIGRDPSQPREEFDPEALQRLADSLKARGLLQPIRVRWDEASGRYLVVAGERRWRASAMAGLATITAIVADEPADAGELLADQLVENCLREDLKPIEQARAYRRLMDLRGWSGNRLAQELAIAQGTVSRALSLLDLPRGLRDRVEQGALSPSVAHEVAKLDDPSAQVEVAEAAISGKMTREAVRSAVREAGEGRKASRRGAPARIRREFRLEDGSSVVVTVPAGSGESAVVAALDSARKLAARRRRDEAA